MKPSPLLPPVTTAIYPLTPKSFSMFKADMVIVSCQLFTLGYFPDYVYETGV